jgi:hypothetical protein
MEEASGTVFDSTANNNDLPVSGSVNYQVPGKVGTYSIEFPSISSYLSGGTANTLGTFPVSISAWISLSGSNHTDMIIDISQFSPTPAGYSLSISNNSVYVGYLGWNFPGQSIPLSNFNLKANTTWRHIVATATGVSGINSVKYWVNGVDTTTSSGYMSTDQVDLPNHNYRVGNRLSTLNAGLGGKMDSVMIWNRVLSEEEILYIYNSGSGRSCP